VCGRREGRVVQLCLSVCLNLDLPGLRPRKTPRGSKGTDDNLSNPFRDFKRLWPLVRSDVLTDGRREGRAKEKERNGGPNREVPNSTAK